MNSIFSIALSLALIVSSSFAVEKTFSETYNQNIYGDIKLVGNTVLEIDANKNETDSTAFFSDDETAYGQYVTAGAVINNWFGYWYDVSAYEANNFTYMKYVDVNNNGDPDVYNSSSSTLTLPAGSTIVFARLYWSGLFHNFNDGTSLDADATASKSVKFKIDGLDVGNGINQFIDVTVNQTNTYAETEGWTELSSASNDLLYSRYSAYKDVTTNLQNLSFDGSSINLTTANVMSNEGWMRNYGNYGAWSLAVVYQNSDESFKNVSLHTGYKLVYNTTDGAVEIPISGFLTPSSAKVTSTLSVFTTEGEKTTLFGTDYLKVANKNDVSRLSVSNSNSYPNSSTNIFDSTITNAETTTPNISNTMGIDIDTFSVGVDGDLSHPQIIENLQTDTVIELSSGGDAYTVNTVALSTELYVPLFCYDYAYKQQDRYFTEDNNGTQTPNLTGDVVTNEPVEITLYLRNMVESDVSISNMLVEVTDINVSQGVYERESVRLALTGDLTPANILDSALSVSDSFVKNVDVGTLGANDFFYLYYKINPLVSTLDMPITVSMNYDLIVDGMILNNFTTTLGSGQTKIEMCTGSNFEYTPTTGVFNVVHNDYYNGSTQFYNLPTQVTSRAGNFQVIALNQTDPNLPEGRDTIVAVELIDAAAFHDSDASCNEMESAISEKVWVIFDNNATSTMFDGNALNAALGLNNSITSASQFYANARENTAFRLSYNVTGDGNANLVQTQLLPDGTYNVLNFAQVVQTIGACSKPVVYPLNANQTGIATQSAQACGNSGNSISAAQLKFCMECIYGFNTRVVCSRDNFSLRPEAFLIKLSDSNQTTAAVSSSRLDEDGLGVISGVSSPTTRILNVAAGYSYNVEVNATNYLNNDSSSGYTKSYGSSTQDLFQYVFDERNSRDVSGCNDVTDKNLSVRFLNGVVDSNASVDQVGEYRLSVTDATWTTVDGNPIYMTRHTSPWFLTSGGAPVEDCLPNVSATQA